MFEEKGTKVTPPVPPTETKGHYLRLKGENAERIVHELADRSFLTDWCYRNPKLPDGKELCDLLVVYDDVAIIWSIKDLTPYKETKAQKSLRQLGGARRELFELKTPIELENPRRGRERFDPTSIKEVFLISVLMGDDPEHAAFAEEVRKQTAHVLTREATEIVLTELDTISDFTEYLRRKEEFLKGKDSVIIAGGEQELLAYYLLEERSFDSLQHLDSIAVMEGVWESFQKRPETKRRNEADRVSYGWDSIIDRAHEGSSRYEIIARELARPNRLERRVLSQSFFDSHMHAHRESERRGDPDGFMFRRVTAGRDGQATYCFLFMEDPQPHERRRAALEAMCFVARGKFPGRRRVLGIATEMRFRPTCSYDFCLIDIENWTEEHQVAADRIQKESGILVNPATTNTHEDEYPAS